MSNYTKSTNFATKDNLTPGDPLKIVRGTEIDTEYNNIATAIATKTDNSAAAITGGTITGITDLAVADGGTGASTAAGALNNLLPSQTSAANKYLQSDGTNASWDAVTLSTADITGTLPVANGGTGVTSSTGTGNVVLSNSPTLVTPALGTPASGVATNLTGLPISTGVSGLGTGVATFLGTPSSANLISAVTDETGTGSLVFATSPTLVTPALGTPSALVGTNITGTASGLTAGNVTTNANLTGAVTSVGNATSLGSFSSSNLAGALTDETGSGSAVFATSPTLVTPILGTPTSATLTNATGLPISTGVSGLGTGVATFLATPSSANLAAALTDETGSGANVFATSPTLVTPILGTPTSATLTNATGLPLTTGVTGTLPTANGGTNLTSFTSGGVVYASSSSALATGSVLQFTGTNLGLGTTSPDVFSRGDARILGIASTGNASVAVNAASGSTSFLQLGSNGVRDFQIQATSSSVTLGTGASGNNPLVFAIGFNEFMRLNTTGLGIGTSSPTQKLSIQGATFVSSSFNGQAIGDVSAERLRIGYKNGTPDTGLVPAQIIADTALLQFASRDTAGGTITFATGSGIPERVRIDNSGNLGIGTSSPSYRVHAVGASGTEEIARFSSAGTDIDAQISVAPTGVGYGRFNSSANMLTLAVAGSNKVFVNSSGNLGLGVTPSAWGSDNSRKGFDISTYGGLTSGSLAMDLVANAFFNGTNWVAKTTGAGTKYVQTGGQHFWQYAGSVSAGSQPTYTTGMTLDTSGGLKTLNTIGVGNATPSTSGAGITFPATQSASSDANTLDDYEEGTWTPTIIGTTTAGTGTYTTQTGSYTKIGNQVTLHLTLTWTAHTGTGNMRISGLPFTVGSYLSAGSVGLCDAISLTASNSLAVYSLTAEARLALVQNPTGGGTAAGVPMDTSAGPLVISITYTV